MKIIFVSIFFYFLSFLSFAQTENNSIQKAVDNFVSLSQLKDASISFMAYNLDSSKLLAGYNSRFSIPSASVTKLFTTAGAIEILGSDYRPKTLFYHSGDIDTNGVLQGDLIIKGLGDASLGSRYFYNQNEKDNFLADWINLLTEKGITQINGKILADGSAFGYQGAPDGWNWSDLGNYYGASPGACSIYDNTVFLHFSTSNNINGSTRLDSMTPHIPDYQLNNRVTTFNANYDNAYIYGAPFSNQRFAIGNLPRGRSNFEVKSSIPDPELMLAQVVERALNKAGIIVSVPATGFRIMSMGNDTVLDYKKLNHLFTYEGKTVQELAYWTNLRSVNLFAEQLLGLIGLEKAGSGETKKSVEYLNKYWEWRLNDITMFQSDGSGLSRSNGFSANHFIELLKYMYNSKNFENFESTLAIAGRSGTLTSLCRGQFAQGRLKGKSGTMRKIKSYAGYINSKSGNKIAFAIIVNNYNFTNNQLVAKMEDIFNEMAKY